MSEIESTLVTDVNRYEEYEPRERIAEGVHERGNRKVEMIYELDYEGDENLLLVKCKYYLKGKLKNESSVRNGPDYRVVDGVVTYNGQELMDFIEDNFHADPEVTLTEEFESMVDEVNNG